jgi:uncharacterized protein YbjT (DUF2867 family)
VQSGGELLVPIQQTVLLLGATGRTGGRVLEQFLERGVGVRAIVRSASRLPGNSAGNANLQVVEASLLSLTDEELQRHLRGCQAVVSCLGHVLSFSGIFGRPRDLVAGAVARVCRGIAALQPAAPVKLIFMSSVSVHRPGGLDTIRGAAEKAFLWLLRALLPPAQDNQRAADYLQAEIGAGHQFVQWVGVRPDTLLDGGVTGYALHAGLKSSIFAPDKTNMANVAHFMCELATSPAAWDQWKGGLPVIVNAAPS